MVNSFHKGKRGELEAVSLLIKHFGKGFRRKRLGTPGSDIETPYEFPWSVEAKNVKTVKLKHLFRPTAELLAYWQQTKRQAKDEGKKPLLIIKIESIWFACVEFDYKTQRDYITVNSEIMVRRFHDFGDLHRAK